MDPEEQRTLKRVLRSRHLAVLTTKGDIYPYPSLVNFASANDLTSLFFATKRNTRKYENIRSNPAVSMLITTASNSPGDLDNAVVVTALGEVIEPSPEEASLARTLLLAQTPGLSALLGDRACAILKVSVRKFIIVSQFDNVREIVPNRQG